MKATLAHARMELNKSQGRYKRNFNRGQSNGNSGIKAGDYVWLDTQDENGKENLGGHTEIPFLVLYLTNHTFVIQRNDLVERVNYDRVGCSPAPTTTEALPENYVN